MKGWCIIIIMNTVISNLEDIVFLSALSGDEDSRQSALEALSVLQKKRVRDECDVQTQVEELLAECRSNLRNATALHSSAIPLDADLLALVAYVNERCPRTREKTWGIHVELGEALAAIKSMMGLIANTKILEQCKAKGHPLDMSPNSINEHLVVNEFVTRWPLLHYTKRTWSQMSDLLKKHNMKYFEDVF